jgi:hypothetical protein
MPISKYHLIKFLINSYDDHNENANNFDWITWFNDISSIYNQNIPESLILAIKRKNNEELNELCNKELERIHLKEKREALALESKEQKYKRWIEKRDAGNLRVLQKIKEKKESDILKQNETIKKANEEYIKMMMSTWEKQHKEYIDSRRSELQNILNVE